MWLESHHRCPRSSGNHPSTHSEKQRPGYHRSFWLSPASSLCGASPPCKYGSKVPAISSAMCSKHSAHCDHSATEAGWLPCKNNSPQSPPHFLRASNTDGLRTSSCPWQLLASPGVKSKEDFWREAKQYCLLAEHGLQQWSLLNKWICLGRVQAY